MLVNFKYSKICYICNMKIYLIRHAPTMANRSGSMVDGYHDLSIINIKKPNDWEETVGQFIPASARRHIFTSPALRCTQTANLLFPQENHQWHTIVTTEQLAEFDCKALGDKKFWEITEAEFKKLVKISPRMMKRQVRAFLAHMKRISEEYHMEDAVAISHGMFIRYLYHYFTGNPGISAYEVINSVGFSFANLDLLILDTEEKTVEYHRYAAPIDHKEAQK